MDTKISIITATWNSARFLPDCLSSIDRQSYVNKEHIIVDGSSTDGTVEFLSNYISDKDAILLSEPDEGIYDALNKGIDLATGDVIGFLHADDLYATSEALSIIAKFFEDSSVCAVYADLEYVDKENTLKVVRRWKGSHFERGSLGWGWMPAHPTFYVRRDWYMKIGRFDASYSIAGDYLSILNFFSHPEFKTVYVPEVLVKMRMGGVSNRSLKTIILKIYEDWCALRSSNFTMLDSLRAIIWKNLRKLLQFF